MPGLSLEVGVHSQREVVPKVEIVLTFQYVYTRSSSISKQQKMTENRSISW